MSATAARVADWRARNPDKQHRLRRKAAARERALRRLGALHPDELERLTREELDLDPLTRPTLKA